MSSPATAPATRRPPSPREGVGVPKRDRQRGQILVMFTLGLVVFLGVSALAIDFGVWLSFHRLYQNVTDAATLAGAPFLSRPLTDSCGTSSKEFCARRETWRY